MSTIAVRTYHSAEMAIRERVNASQRLTDNDALGIAALWQSPGTDGRHFAAFASGAPVAHTDLLDDINATLNQYATLPVDRKALQMFTAWIMRRTEGGHLDWYAAYGPNGRRIPDWTPYPVGRYRWRDAGDSDVAQSSKLTSGNGWTSEYDAQTDSYHVRTPSGDFRMYTRLH